MNFKEQVSEGIPDYIPENKDYDTSVNHAPVRENLLSYNEKKEEIKKS